MKKALSDAIHLEKTRYPTNFHGAFRGVFLMSFSGSFINEDGGRCKLGDLGGVESPVRACSAASCLLGAAEVRNSAKTLSAVCGDVGPAIFVETRLANYVHGFNKPTAFKQEPPCVSPGVVCQNRKSADRFKGGLKLSRQNMYSGFSILWSLGH
jgi:hypothetical protein